MRRTPATTSKRNAGVRALWWGAAAIGLVVVARSGWLLSTSMALTRHSEALQHLPARPALRLLIVGDSTAVGTGASTPQASLAGLLAGRFAQLQIDNRGRDGATFADLMAQLEGHEPADMVLVMAGGNDVVRMRGLDGLRTDIDRVMLRAQQRAAQVVLMPPGNVGNAPFFLPPVSWWMAWRSRRLQAMAAEAAARHGALHVNLFRESADDPFVTHPHLNAADGLHPADAGYRAWFAELMVQAGLSQRLSAAL